MVILSHVKSWLPYLGRNFRIGLKVDTELSPLTILVGPNASGKTSILEAIGYSLSGALGLHDHLVGLMLTSTLRPVMNIPLMFGAKTRINKRDLISFFIEAMPSQIAKRRIKNVFDTISPELEAQEYIIKRILRDLDDLLPIVHILSKRPIELSSYEKQIKLLFSQIEDFLGQNFQSGIARKFGGLLRYLRSYDFDADNASMIRIFRPFWRIKFFKIGYTFVDSDKLYSKYIFLGGNLDVILFKKQREPLDSDFNLAIFHPGFTFWPGTFESLYSYYARTGLPNEKEAIKLISEYIDWFDGFEIISDELHARSKYRRRISIYSLSDGYRVVILLGLLYAMSGGSKIFLIDTPEAFIHPDGLSIVAKLIAHLASMGNSVILATQSIEFIHILIKKAANYNILEDTAIHRVSLDDGTIKNKGVWRGLGIRGMLEDLYIDIRK